VAVALSVAGVVIINVSGEPFRAQGGWTMVLGSLFVFGAVCSATAYSLFAKKVSSRVRPILLIPLAAWVATLLFAFPGLYQASSFDFSTPTLEHWIALLWWRVGPFGIGTMLWFVGLARVQASIASGFMGVMPASGLVVSYVWLGETFYWIHMAGFALVLGGIGMVAWAHQVSERTVTRWPSSIGASSISTTENESTSADGLRAVYERPGCATPHRQRMR
jgi:drug/metabolite transporter (DMT)-like permease